MIAPPMNPYNITLLDQSPLFQYLPSQEGPVATSWNTTYSGSLDSAWLPHTTGIGESSHRTRLSGASVRLDWVGTALYLQGNASLGRYSIYLDGRRTMRNATADTPNLLFTCTHLRYGPHSLVLVLVQGEISISSTIITVGMGQLGSTITNSTIHTTTIPLPSATTDIILSGPWEASIDISSPRIATRTSGSTLSFHLTSAIAFSIHGYLDLDHGPYHVTLTPPPDLGPPQVFRYNASSHWTTSSSDTIKFLATGLHSSRTYHIEVVNDSEMLYDQTRIIVYDTQPGTLIPSSISGGPVLSAGGVAGVVIGSALVLFALFIFLFRIYQRKQSQDDPDNPLIVYGNWPADTITTNAGVAVHEPSESNHDPQPAPATTPPGPDPAPQSNSGVASSSLPAPEINTIDVTEAVRPSTTPCSNDPNPT